MAFAPRYHQRLHEILQVAADVAEEEGDAVTRAVLDLLFQNVDDNNFIAALKELVETDPTFLEAEHPRLLDFENDDTPSFQHHHASIPHVAWDYVNVYEEALVGLWHGWPDVWWSVSLGPDGWGDSAVMKHGPFDDPTDAWRAAYDYIMAQIGDDVAVSSPTFEDFVQEFTYPHGELIVD